MQSQISFDKEKPTCYIVPTPIGNLDDMTYRSVAILKKVAVIFAEDTRHSGVLLKHYAIETPMRSYHKHNERMRNESIINQLASGDSVALVSDAGTPLISDPGATLVSAVIEAGFSVVSVPGASAFLTALVASNQTSSPFLFYGFLPNKTGAKERVLKTLKTVPYTLLFYEAPHRIMDTLKTMQKVFKTRKVTLARELTKKYETYYRFSLDDLDDLQEMKGEMVIVVEGFLSENPLNEEDIIGHIELLILDGMSEMQAIKEVAKQREMKKNVVYMAYQVHKKNFKEKE